MNAETVILERIAVCAHSEHDPTDAEWTAMVRELERKRGTFDSIVVVTLGAAPTAAQRKQLKALIDSVRRTIVVTDSAIARGAVTALSWLGANIEATPLAALRTAFESLGCSADAVQRLCEATQAALERVAPGSSARVGR